MQTLETRALLTTFHAIDFGSIQEAIDAAAANPGADTVAIAPGVYQENLEINDASGALTLRGTGQSAADVVIDG